MHYYKAGGDLFEKSNKVIYACTAHDDGNDAPNDAVRVSRLIVGVCKAHEK